MKKLFSILIPAFIVSVALAVYFNQNASRHQEDLTQERYLRMVTEENLEKANSKINSLEDQIAKIKNKNSNVEKLLEQKAADNLDLKAKLEKTSTIKEALEGKIKELEKNIPAEDMSSSVLPNVSDDKI